MLFTTFIFLTAPELLLTLVNTVTVLEICFVIDDKTHSSSFERRLLRSNLTANEQIVSNGRALFGKDVPILARERLSTVRYFAEYF